MYIRPKYLRSVRVVALISELEIYVVVRASPAPATTPTAARWARIAAGGTEVMDHAKIDLVRIAIGGRDFVKVLETARRLVGEGHIVE